MTEEPKQQDKDTQESEENGRWDKIKGFFLDNPTLALTFLYLYVTAVGMLYSAVLYGRFGINVFDYSEIGDFLLAAFKNPVAFLSAALLAAMGVALLSYRTAVLRNLRVRVESRIQTGERQRMETVDPRDTETVLMQVAYEQMADETRDIMTGETWKLYFQRARRQTVIFAIIIVLTGFFSSFILPYYSANETASSIKDGENLPVEVRYRSFSGSAGQVTVPGLEFIGATQRAAFFYDVDEKRTIVIPQAQIVSIEVPE